MDCTPPLANITIIAVEQYGAGPWATAQLAALGADVIKVEDAQAGGDVGRYVPPFQEGEHSLFFESFNMGKRSVSLDLRTDTGRRAFEDLVRAADVVFSNVRGDHVERLGLRYEDLRPLNPGIVCCSITGYGRTGPRRAQGAYDYGIQGIAGWMSLTGAPDAPPTRAGLSLVDVSAGYVAALAICAALVRRAATGEGGDADISLFETALAMNMYVGTWVLSQGYEPTRLPDSAHPSIVPFQSFPTADGWIVVCCPKESLFRRFAEAIGLPDMPADPRFADFNSRRAHRQECVGLITERLRQGDTDGWLTTLEQAGVPCGPVNDVAAAFDDPQALARDVVDSYQHEMLGDVRVPRSAVRVDGSPRLGRAPYRGEHTAEVMRSLCGYDDDAISALDPTPG